MRSNAANLNSRVNFLRDNLMPSSIR